MSTFIETRINFKNNDSAIAFAESTPEHIVRGYSIAQGSQLVIFSKADGRFGKDSMAQMKEEVFTKIKDFNGELVELFPVERKPTYVKI